jgi:hypothetical protein
MSLCLVCHASAARALSCCSGFRVPVCGSRCSELLHDLLLVGGPVGGDPAKRKLHDEAARDESSSSSAKGEQDGSPKRPKRESEALAGSPLSKLTSLLLQASPASRHNAILQAEQQAQTGALPVIAPSSDWSKLPAELRLMILSGLPLLDLIKLTQNSPVLYRNMQQESLWKYFCTGPLARLFGAPQRLCLRTWREQGRTLLHSTSYLIWRPQDRSRPVRYVMHPDEPKNQPVMEVYFDETRVYRLSANAPWLKLVASPLPVFLRFGGPIWFQIPIPDSAAAPSSFVDASIMPRGWAPPPDAGVRVIRYQGAGWMYEASVERDFQVRAVHVHPTGIASFGFEAPVGDDDVHGIPADTPYRANLSVTMSDDASMICDTKSPLYKRIRSLRVHFKAPPSESLRGIPLLDPKQQEFAPADAESWRAAATLTLLQWQQDTADAPNGEPHDILTITMFLTVVAPQRPIWMLDRTASEIHGARPSDQAVLQQQTLRVELDLSSALARAWQTALENSFAVLQEYLKGSGLPFSDRVLARFVAPSSPRVMLGLAVAYREPGSERTLTSLIPIDRGSLFDAQRSAVELTHGLEGIGKRV